MLPTERFWAKVEPGPGDCLVWRGAKTLGGYGQFYFEGHLILAHRWAYEAFKGPIPKGLDIDHLCRVRACVWPDHLEPVTRSENLRRGDLRWNSGGAAKTHCPQGHPYDETNTRMTNGHRQCRTCGRARWHRWKTRQRATDMGLGISAE